MRPSALSVTASSSSSSPSLSPPARSSDRELETLIAAYQRENEKSTRASEASKARERLLEQALEKQIGPSWADILEIRMSPHASVHISTHLPSADNSIIRPPRLHSRLPRPRSTSLLLPLLLFDPPEPLHPLHLLHPDPSPPRPPSNVLLHRNPYSPP